MRREVFASSPGFPRRQRPCSWCVTRASSQAHSGPTAPHALVCAQAGACLQPPALLLLCVEPRNYHYHNENVCVTTGLP